MELKDRRQVTEHQLTSDRQHDDAEELTDDIERRRTQIFGQPVRADQHQVQHQHTEQQRDTEARDAILRRDGQQRRESTRTRIHREGQRNNRTRATQFALQLIVLEDRDVQNHLQRHQEDDESAGDGEVLDLHAEELQDPFAQEQERHQDDHTRDTYATGMNLNALLLHRDSNGDISERVNDGYQKDKRRQYLPDIYCSEKST